MARKRDSKLRSDKPMVEVKNSCERNHAKIQYYRISGVSSSHLQWNCIRPSQIVWRTPPKFKQSPQEKYNCHFLVSDVPKVCSNFRSIGTIFPDLNDLNYRPNTLIFNSFLFSHYSNHSPFSITFNKWLTDKLFLCLIILRKSLLINDKIMNSSSSKYR